MGSLYKSIFEDYKQSVQQRSCRCIGNIQETHLLKCYCRFSDACLSFNNIIYITCLLHILLRNVRFAASHSTTTQTADSHI